MAIDTAGLLPEELKLLCRDVRDGKTPAFKDIMYLIRNGLVRRQDGMLILTQYGSRASASLDVEIAADGTIVGVTEDDSDQKNTLEVKKQANGQFRWYGISSTAYCDADGEIVSAAALFDDVERTKKTGDYGPLLWWHKEKAVLGTCDFSMIAGPGGKYLVESGLFLDPLVGLAVKNNAHKLGVSIRFCYPKSDLVTDGGLSVFKRIHRVERSILPEGQAANRFTSFGVI